MTIKDTKVFFLEKSEFLLFLIISIPFLFLSTKYSLFNQKIEPSSIPLFERLNISLLDEKYFLICTLVILILFFFSFLKNSKVLLTLFWVCFIYWSGHYESFFFISDEIFANGCSIPILYFLIYIMSPLSFKATEEQLNLKNPCLWVIPASFGAAGISKLHLVGTSWLSAENISLIMRYRFLLTGNSIACYVSNSYYISIFIALLVLSFEIFGFLLLLFFPLWVYGAATLLVVLPTYFAMGIDEFLPLYFPFISIYFKMNIKSLLGIKK